MRLRPRGGREVYYHWPNTPASPTSSPAPKAPAKRKRATNEQSGRRVKRRGTDAGTQTQLSSLQTPNQDFVAINGRLYAFIGNLLDTGVARTGAPTLQALTVDCKDQDDGTATLDITATVRAPPEWCPVRQVKKPAAPPQEQSASSSSLSSAQSLASPSHADADESSASALIPQQGWKSPQWPPGNVFPRGMRNPLFFCYRIAAIMVLSTSENIVRSIFEQSQQHSHDEAERLRCTTCVLRDVAASIWGEDSTDALKGRVEKLWEHIRLVGARKGQLSWIELEDEQFDIDEPLSWLIDRMFGNRPGPKNPVAYGVNRTRNCPLCSHEHMAFDDQSMIRIPVSVCEDGEHLLESMRSPMGLDIIECPNCHETLYMPHDTAHLLQPPPSALLIQLVRNNGSKKDTKQIVYPIDLDWSKFGPADGQYNYSLSVVVCHRGSLVMKGHYVTYVNTKAGIAFVNDDETLPATQQQMLDPRVREPTDSAVMLVYERQNPISEAPMAGTED